MLILAVWTYSNLLLLPIYSGVRINIGHVIIDCEKSVAFQSRGTFGFNCLIGKCDFVPGSSEDLAYLREVMYGIGFTLPCVLCTISYSVIWGYVWSAGRYLKKSG